MQKEDVIAQTFAHLIVQAERSIKTNGSMCRYRGKDGLKCAVGFWIPDEKYDPEIEGRSASSSLVVACLPPEIAEHTDVLLSLQHFHDELPWYENSTMCFNLIQAFVFGINSDLHILDRINSILQNKRGDCFIQKYNLESNIQYFFKEKGKT